MQPINGRTIERICPTGLVDKLAPKECPETTTANATVGTSDAFTASLAFASAVAAVAGITVM